VKSFFATFDCFQLFAKAAILSILHDHIMLAKLNELKS